MTWRPGDKCKDGKGLRVLASKLGVPLEEIGLSEDRNVHYEVPADVEDTGTFMCWAPEYSEFEEEREELEKFQREHPQSEW